MFRKFLFWFLIILGLINSLIVIVSSIVGPNAYVLAESISKYFNIILGYVPFFLVCTSLFWFVFDKFNKVDSKINYFAIAFFGILSDAIFAIGTIFFMQK